MQKTNYDLPIFSDDDTADLNEYSEEMAAAIKVQLDKFGNPLIFKGNVETLESLEQIENAENGHIYGVVEENKNYIYNGENWEEYSEKISSAHDQLIISPVEPMGLNRKKVWIQRGKNCFNKNKISTNHVIFSGGEGTSTSTNTSDYMPLKANVSYVFSCKYDTLKASGTRTYKIYNKDKQEVSAIDYDSANKNLSVTSTVDGYIRISYDQNCYDIQFEQGEIATEYEEYIEEKIYIKNENDIYEEFVSNTIMKKIENVEKAVTTENRIKYMGIIGGDFNNIIKSGFYMINGTSKTNIPAGVNVDWGMLLVFQIDLFYVQIIMKPKAGLMYLREHSGTVPEWNPWKKVTLS